MMININKSLAYSVLTVTLLPIIQACSYLKPHESVLSKLYIGAGVSATRLEPDISETNFNIDSEHDNGEQATIGYEATDAVSLELEYAELGKATLTPEGRASYKATSASALYYPWNSKNSVKEKKGVSLFARLGAAQIKKTTPVLNKTEHDQHLIVGLGTEYGFNNGVAVRGELVSYDDEAARAGISVLYRFAGKQSQKAITKQSTKEITSSFAIDESVDETDNKPIDEALALPTQYEMIFFNFDSSLISEQAALKLSNVTNILTDDSGVNLLLEGYTDSLGAFEYNMDLALRRAAATKKHLVKKGIEANRLRISALGERNPISDNNDIKQRFKNRRVQIIDDSLQNKIIY